jgi:tetratricopeptide (TPR) repeat protein
MKIRPGSAWLVAVLTWAAFHPSCAPPKSPSLRPDTSRAQRYVVVGDYERAIASYAEIAAGYADDRSLLREYAGVVESIKAKADRSFDAADYGNAETLYSLLSANFPLFAAIEGSLTFGPLQVNQRASECRIILSERRARQSLAAGEYQKALDGYRVFPAGGLQDPGVSAGLKRIVEELKRLADKASARKDFVAAGKAYAALENGYPLAEQAGLSLSFPRNAAAEGVEKCRVQLTKDGLDLYRRGRLEEAIAVWRGLLEFDPDNIEIRKAVETATEQLKRLKMG